MTAMFELTQGGVGVMPDPDDNAAGHDVRTRILARASAFP